MYTNKDKIRDIESAFRLCRPVGMTVVCAFSQSGRLSAPPRPPVTSPGTGPVSAGRQRVAPGFLVDEAGDPLDSTPPGQVPDGGLHDALEIEAVKQERDTKIQLHLDVITKDFTELCLLAPPFPPFPCPDILVKCWLV